MEPSDNCRNCHAHLEGAYCSQCGQIHLTERFTAKGFYHNFLRTITNFDRGFWYTMKMLFLRPADVIRDYVGGRIRPYYHPLRYTFIILGISVLINLGTGAYDTTRTDINDAFVLGEMSEQAIETRDSIQENIEPFLNIIPLLLIPFIGFFSYRLFRKKGYNYGEHLILTTFSLGQVSLIGLPITTCLILSTGVSWYGLVLGVFLWGVYYAIIVRRLFDISFAGGFVKGILNYLLGYLGFFLVIGVVSAVLGLVIGLIMIAFR